MAKKKVRVERDSLGEVRVPAEALYGAQTQRALENFQVSGLRFPRVFIEALGLIKSACALVNRRLKLLDARRARAIERGAARVASGSCDAHFPLDIFQTGSGTSTNMNANEVIARLAGTAVHPNDHVNMCQSSNDVIPSAIHISAALACRRELLPALEGLKKSIDRKARGLDKVVKTGRTHLMDALPLTMRQELSGWSAQVGGGMRRVRSALPAVCELALGATAVGTGLNAPRSFGRLAARELARRTRLPLRQAPNLFEKLAAQDAAVELSGQLRTAAVSLLKIANDLRWMNSGPQAGLGEIVLPALQPGSSIMPGKVNPVAPEAAAMACVQVLGNDAAIVIAGQSGNFQLNVMLPVIAHNLLQSIAVLAGAARLLTDAVRGFQVNRKRLADLAERNPILVTALNPVTGYALGAEIAKRAYAEGRRVEDAAAGLTNIGRRRLGRLLDPRRLTRGGIKK
ncbi:MAG: class II fumarate hydratase [Elusimicrobiota bacterium]